MAIDPRFSLHEIRQALGMSQQDVGRLIGVSRRTAQRLDAGQSSLAQHHLATLAQAIHPRNPELAARIAARGNMTLESVGIKTLAPAPAPAPIAAPAAPAPFAVSDVLCAAADAMGSTPRAARQVLLIAFRRAKELGLGVDAVVGALEAGEPRGAKN